MPLIYTPLQVSFQAVVLYLSWLRIHTKQCAPEQQKLLLKCHTMAGGATALPTNCDKPQRVGDQDIYITKKAFYLNYSTVPVHSLSIISRKTTVYFRRLHQLGDFKQFPNFSPPTCHYYADQNPILYTSTSHWRCSWAFKRTNGEAGTWKNQTVNQSPDILHCFNQHRTVSWAQATCWHQHQQERLSDILGQVKPTSKVWSRWLLIC